MRFGKYRTDDKVLHDEYFGEQPSAAFLLAVRLVLLCLMSASFVLIYCDIYGRDTDPLIPAGIAAGFTGIIYILTSVCPPAIIYGSSFLAACGTVWVIRDRVIDGAAYYWDYMMMRTESRLLRTSTFILHEELRRDPPLGSAVDESVSMFFWSAVALAFICSVIFTAAARTRFHITVPIIMITVITAPGVASEIAGFSPSFLLFIMSVFGFEAVYSSYELDNKFIYGSLTAAHMSDMRADRDHRRYVLKLPIRERLESDTLRYHKYSGNMISMALITAVLFFSASYIIPDGKGLGIRTVLETLDSIWTSAADKVEDIFGISIKPVDDKGYFSSDSFGNITGNISIRPPGDSDRPVLEVTLSRNDIPVYLRGDIGVEYSGGSWTSITAYSDEYKNAVSESFYPESEYQVFRRYLAWTESAVSPEDAVPLQMVSVKYLRGTRVVFEPLAPYELNYKTNEQFDSFGDSILRTKFGNVKSFNGLALTPCITDKNFTAGGHDGKKIVGSALAEGASGERFALENELISVPDMTNAEYLEQIRRYRAFIETEYMTPSHIPAIVDLSHTVGSRGISSEWDKLISGDAANDNEARYLSALALCRYFSENYTYSLDIDDTEDALDRFLNDTHSGHCALFATAMTLALRELGIPARYVTGYVAYPENGTTALNGYKYVLTEKQLHAWTEVYFRGIGWLPFDPTADVQGYSGRAEVHPPETDTAPVTQVTEESLTTTETSAAAEEPVTEQTTDTSADTTVPPPITDNGGDPHPMSNRDTFLRLLPMIIIMAVIAAFAVIAVLFFRSLANAEKRTIKSFRALPPSEATAIMYRFVMTLLAKKGLTPGNEQFYDFAERVDGSIEMKGLNNFMMDVMPVFEKCEFADPKVSPVTEDERIAVYHYVSAVYGKIMDDASYFGRIILKISLFL